MSSSTNNGTRDVKIADDGATHGEPWEGKQIMLILCGLIASGKVHTPILLAETLSHLVFGASHSRPLPLNCSSTFRNSLGVAKTI